MIEGRMAGICAAEYLGFCAKTEKQEALQSLNDDLNELRQGMFAPKNRGKKLPKTEEGIDISTTLLTQGHITKEEAERFPGVIHEVGVHPVMECTQNIPCNPCQDACPKHCIKIGSSITSLPQVDPEVQCIGCGMCVASCSGQAIFLLNEEYEPGFTAVTLPYEFLPLPQKGSKGKALDRAGKPVCDAEVVGVKASPAFDHTALLTIKVPKENGMDARFYKEALEL